MWSKKQPEQGTPQSFPKTHLAVGLDLGVEGNADVHQLLVLELLLAQETQQLLDAGVLGGAVLVVALAQVLVALLNLADQLLKLND